MLRRHIIMLIAICPSDGDVKPGGPLSAFREEQATSRHRVSPSLFLSSSSHTPQHNYTTQTTTHTVTLSSIPTVPYTDTRPRCNVVYPSGAWFENRPCSTPSICPVQDLKCVIVQWVGIGTHTHNPKTWNYKQQGTEECNHQTGVSNSNRSVRFYWKIAYGGPPPWTFWKSSAT